MAKWKILLTDGLEDNGQEILRAEAEVVNNPAITADELLTVVGEYDALIVRGRTKVTKAVFDAGKKLKVVGRAGVGVDNIDLNAAKEAGVIVVNSPTATTIAVAELTLGLMLAASRDIPRGDAGMKSGKWLKKEMEGKELWHKTLGVIGYGRIGQATAQRARAFDMNVIAYDPLIQPGDIQNHGAIPVTFDELLEQSDLITMHIPLTPESKNLLNADAFAKMKNGVIIVCAARGGVIDEAALLESLNSGKVACAALDVYATEPPGLNDLVAHPRVIGVPHIGAQTAEAQVRAAEDISTEVLSALAGNELRWQVA